VSLTRVKSRSSGTVFHPNFWRKTRPCRGSQCSNGPSLCHPSSSSYSHPLICSRELAHAAMACIPLSFPPSSVTPKLEPEATPAPAHAPAWKLPNLGPYPTSHASRNGVQKKRQTFNLPYRQKSSLAHLTPEEQVVQLRQSRKAIKSKLYGKIARLQVGAARLMPLDTPTLMSSKAGV
jgi:hypothetical protein